MIIKELNNKDLALQSFILTESKDYCNFTKQPHVSTLTKHLKTKSSFLNSFKIDFIIF